MFYGFFTTSGRGSLVTVDGMMNSSKYIEILKSKVLPFLQTFADGKGTFQHDLAPCHNSKAVKKFIQENKISMLDWPGNSPDMSSVGNLWSVLRKRLGKVDCSTEERMVTNVVKVRLHLYLIYCKFRRSKDGYRTCHKIIYSIEYIHSYYTTRQYNEYNSSKSYLFRYSSTV
jgi:transposase